MGKHQRGKAGVVLMAGNQYAEIDAIFDLKKKLQEMAPSRKNFNYYWTALGKFLQFKLNKCELEDIIYDKMGKGCISLHNKLIISLLCVSDQKELPMFYWDYLPDEPDSRINRSFGYRKRARTINPEMPDAKLEELNKELLAPYLGDFQSGANVYDTQKSLIEILDLKQQKRQKQRPGMSDSLAHPHDQPDLLFRMKEEITTRPLPPSDLPPADIFLQPAPTLPAGPARRRGAAAPPPAAAALLLPPARLPGRGGVAAQVRAAAAQHGLGATRNAAALCQAATAEYLGRCLAAAARVDQRARGGRGAAGGGGGGGGGGGMQGGGNSTSSGKSAETDMEGADTTSSGRSKRTDRREQEGATGPRFVLTASHLKRGIFSEEGMKLGPNLVTLLQGEMAACFADEPFDDVSGEVLFD